MSRSMVDIVKGYKFKDKVAMLLRSDRKNDYVIRCRGFNAFNAVRELVASEKLVVTEAKWLKDFEKRFKEYSPDIKQVCAFDDQLLVVFDLRDFTIEATLYEERHHETVPYSSWSIQGNLSTFRALLNVNLDYILAEMLERAYQRELDEEKFKALQRIAAKLHADVQVAPAAA